MSLQPSSPYLTVSVSPWGGHGSRGRSQGGELVGRGHGEGRSQGRWLLTSRQCHWKGAVHVHLALLPTVGIETERENPSGSSIQDGDRLAVDQNSDGLHIRPSPQCWPCDLGQCAFFLAVYILCVRAEGSRPGRPTSSEVLCRRHLGALGGLGSVAGSLGL